MKKLLEKLFSNKIVNTNGYTRSDTGKEVHSYLRTHPKNKGKTKSFTRFFINAIKKKD
ncbi:MAG: hypothetical protein Q4A42_04260 [Tissierellia bacterium]|nr:hypothetical protein [Tissierellia bacterium]